jgi:hypothetical protein
VGCAAACALTSASSLSTVSHSFRAWAVLSIKQEDRCPATGSEEQSETLCTGHAEWSPCKQSLTASDLQQGYKGCTHVHGHRGWRNKDTAGLLELLLLLGISRSASAPPAVHPPCAALDRTSTLKQSGAPRRGAVPGTLLSQSSMRFCLHLGSSTKYATTASTSSTQTMLEEHRQSAAAGLPLVIARSLTHDTHILWPAGATIKFEGLPAQPR